MKKEYIDAYHALKICTTNNKDDAYNDACAGCPYFGELKNENACHYRAASGSVKYIEALKQNNKQLRVRYDDLLFQFRELDAKCSRLGKIESEMLDVSKRNATNGE